MANLPAYVFLILLIATSFTATATSRSRSSEYAMKGAYWPSWAESSFPPSAIDTSLFTHVYYAFLAPSNVTYKFNIDRATAYNLANFTSTLRSKRPSVKTLFSVGGAEEGPILFARMAGCRDTRKNFIDSSIEVARKFGFDGIDLDWEFPQSPKEMEDLGYLLSEWRLEVQKEAKATGRPPLLLAAATYFASDFFLSDVYRSYPVASMSKNLDWINAMCYDYHGSWDLSATGAQAALYDSKSNVTTSYGLGSWLRAGVPGSKLVMGLPLYGRSWKLMDPDSHGVGAPAVGVGPGDKGAMTYSEVEVFNQENNATVVYDPETVSTYSVAGTTWIGYDDSRSTAVKVTYAKALGLRGYFFWAVNGDYQWKLSRTASQMWIL